MTKALIEKLEEYRSRYHNEVAVAEDIIDDCIDIVKQHSDWILCSEHLPDDGRTVLIIDCGEVNFGQYSDGLWQTMGYGQYAHNCEVKFWQPLPQPPSEVQP